MKKAKDYASEYIDRVFQKKENQNLVLKDILVLGFFKDFEAIIKARNIDTLFRPYMAMSILTELDAKWHSMSMRINKYITSIPTTQKETTIINPSGLKDYMSARFVELKNISW